MVKYIYRIVRETEKEIDYACLSDRKKNRVRLGFWLDIDKVGNRHV